MKNLLTSVAILSCTVLTLQGQVTLGLRVGVSPEKSPVTSFLIVNRQDPVNECLFNIQKVTFKPLVGLVVRMENDHFWFTGELLYSQTSAYYSVEYSYSSYFPAPLVEQATGNDIEYYRIQKDYIELPVSAGVKLGMIEISSGLSVSKDLKVENQLQVLNGYTTSQAKPALGWHAGVGFNLQLVILELRYHRTFTNYGDNQFMHDQELSLRSPADRLTAMITVRI